MTNLDYKSLSSSELSDLAYENAKDEDEYWKYIAAIHKYSAKEDFEYAWSYCDCIDIGINCSSSPKASTGGMWVSV